MITNRANKTEEERDAVRGQDRRRKNTTRQHNATKVQFKEGLKSEEILYGTYLVVDSVDSNDNIEKMDNRCANCQALKFKKERGSTCCSNGKVVLPEFPRPPEELHQLWHDNSPESCLFRQHARSINNAVCLTSIKVKERSFQGNFNPSIVF